jgi:predicted DNA-binding ribbon-helix-helix protein
MSFSYHNIEANLKRTARRWKWLRFWQQTAHLGMAVLVVFLVIGFALTRDWITHPTIVRLILGLTCISAFVLWLMSLASTLSKNLSRWWLAENLETSRPELEDRLNTLVFLEGVRKHPAIKPFFKRIEKQTHQVLQNQSASLPFSPRRALAHLGAALVLMIGTLLFYERSAPFSHLRAPPTNSPVQTAGLPAPDLDLPDTTAVEEQKNWGEVRITDPGQDLKVTKVDAVALQIEAATSQPIKEVAWATGINGDKESVRALPPPAERKYAVYQPVLYMDELGLSDWDVVTYYAKANTEKNEAYASDIYFLEVRPFREEILKLQGKNGSSQCYNLMKEITGLIQRQQLIIRQTHKYLQSVPDQPHLAEQDRTKLSEAERDLNDAVKHLYAKITTEMENKPVGEVLDHLAKAESWMTSATTNLLNEVSTGLSQEQSALKELVASRKSFQKTITENPEAFEGQDGNDHGSDMTRIAEPSDKLKTMAEFRNEAKAMRDLVKQTLRQQEDLAQRAAVKPRAEYPKLAQEEKKLREGLEEFKSAHPEAFKPLEESFADALKAMKDSEEALEKKTAAARENPKKAAEKLAALDRQMESRQLVKDLSNAYQLKKMLDQQIEQFSKLEQQPDSFNQEQLEQLAEETKQTTAELKKLAEEQPTRDAFGPKLRDELKDEKKQQLDAKVAAACQSPMASGRPQAAGAAKSDLARVSQAFTESQPQVLQQAQANDPFQQGSDEAFQLGLKQLESLLRQKQNGRPLPAQDEQSQRREAFQNLMQGLSRQDGNNNEYGRDVIALIERELRDRGEPIDIEALKKLQEKLTRFAVEMQDEAKPDEKAMTYIDPARLPPSYRGPIEKYFQKLSEKK